MELADNIVKINLLRKQFEELLPLSKEVDHKLWQKFRLEWNFNSNHIEGNTLTYGETQLLLIFDKTTGNHELREFEEMRAHDAAIHAIKEWAHDKTQEFAETDIRNLNKIILVRPYWKEAMTYDGQPTRRQIKVGDYKEHPNSVRLKTGEMFHYASPAETPLMMHELLEWYRSNDLQNTLVLAAELHYRFIRIHPFDDGNGRIARLLVNYVLMKGGYPPVIVKSTDKDAYLTALQKADSGDRGAFHNYMAEQLIWSLEIAIRAAKGENIEEQDDVEKEVAIWKKQLKGNSADVVARSEPLIYELYENGIRQLFELFIEKMKQFDELFASKEIRGWVNGGNSNNAGIENISNYFVRQGNTQEQNEYLKMIGGHTTQIDPIRNFSLKITLKGFKKDGTNAFDEISEIFIEFHPFIYRIIINNGLGKDNLYTEYINIENAKSIVNDCIKKTFEQIKSRVKSFG